MSLVRTPAPDQACEPLHVAMAGPVLTHPLVPFLDDDSAGLPEGAGGAGSAVWQLVVALMDLGHRVSVVTLDGAATAPVTARGRLLSVDYRPRRECHSMRDFLRRERQGVRDGLRHAQPPIVHAHWCGEYALGALASGVPTLVTVHDWMPAVLRMTEPRYLPHWSGRTLLYFAALARARYLTANSPYTAAKVRRFTRAALEVVPNGVLDKEFRPMDERYDTRSPLPEPPLVLSVNNGFGPRKNVKVLLQAFHAVRQRGIECELHLIGEGYAPGGPCDLWARHERLADGVAFLGTLSREEVLARMGRATVLAHAAREEAFGMTLVEAMSQRLPVIAGARSGAVPWVLGSGRAGMLVDVEDAGALADAIAAVLLRPERREGLARQGYEYAWNNYRQSRVADLYLDVYRRVLADAGHRGSTRG